MRAGPSFAMVDSPRTDELIGVGATGTFVCSLSALVWLALKVSIGLRLSQAEEALGIDKSELGTLAYPDFRLAQPL